MTADQKVFRYAVALCKRIRMELNIFQIIPPASFLAYKETIKKKGLMARKFMEGTMVAATYAEAGEPEIALDIMERISKKSKRLLQASEKAGVHCHFSMKSGIPEKEIVDYVKNHRDVVLTIYDWTDTNVRKATGISGNKNVLTKIKNDLSVPLVTVQK